MFKTAEIQWKDNGSVETVDFYIGDFNEEYDDMIFYYVDSLEELESLKSPDNEPEFFITKIF